MNNLSFNFGEGGNPELSKQVQDILFVNGIIWCDSGKNYTELNSQFIYVSGVFNTEIHTDSHDCCRPTDPLEFVKEHTIHFTESAEPEIPQIISVACHWKEDRKQCFGMRPKILSGEQVLQRITDTNTTENHPHKLYDDAYNAGEWIGPSGMIYRLEK